MAKKVTLEGLPDAIAEILEEYSESVVKASHEATKLTAKAGANEINSAAAGAVGGKKYKRSWKSKTENTRIGVGAVIYSTIPGLPHLLEHGHVTRNGTGRTFPSTPARPHIAAAAEQINRSFGQNVVKMINSASYGVKS